MKRFVFLFILLFSSLCVGRSAFIDKLLLTEMPILVYDVAKGQFVSHSNYNLSSYLGGQYRKATNKVLKKELEKDYSRYNSSNIVIREVLIAENGEFFYVEAYRVSSKRAIGNNNRKIILIDKKQ